MECGWPGPSLIEIRAVSDDGFDNPADRSDPAMVWPKQCRCGLSYSEDTWQRLYFVGIDHDYQFEFRNCDCGSTLAIPRVETGSGT